MFVTLYSISKYKLEYNYYHYLVRNTLPFKLNNNHFYFISSENQFK